MLNMRFLSCEKLYHRLSNILLSLSLILEITDWQNKLLQWAKLLAVKMGWFMYMLPTLNSDMLLCDVISYCYCLYTCLSILFNSVSLMVLSC